MPISIEEFDSAPVPELRPSAAGTENAERVVSFLVDHADEAFTPGEIREATAVPRGSVCVVLSRLEDQGRARHRGAYWAAGGDGIGHEEPVEQPDA